MNRKKPEENDDASEKLHGIDPSRLVIRMSLKNFFHYHPIGNRLKQRENGILYDR